MANIEERVAAMEARIRDLEDHLELFQLMSKYGPAVDGDLPQETSEIWTEDGEYDWGGGSAEAAQRSSFRNPEGEAHGRAEIAGIVTGDVHQGFIKGGAAHLISMPHISVDGDRAVGTGYSRVYRYDGEKFQVARLSSNRWEFVRTNAGWRVKRRVNRLLNGSEEARELLRRGVKTRQGDVS